MTTPAFELVVTANGDIMVVDQLGYTLGLFPDVNGVVVGTDKVWVWTTPGKFTFNLWVEEGVPKYSFYRFAEV
jgi:hypothetical protein